MTIIIKQKNQRQKILIGVFLIVSLAGVFVMWQWFFKKQEQVIVEPISVVPRDEEIKIDFDTLNHPFLKASQPFFEIQPFQTDASNTVGRENPFIVQ